ncbi:M81 family metallopeptidase [Billgrantia kenyensis]|uniref:Microcystinase C n=1 Tax=Billgrantia kenyensis TaxID=321266 RepID=A0A7V9VZQ1_9GAMM|nr:M81 family metallopeptidase [Halomonas kenyensis]MBA2778425.1 M81 family metallopeptidase [Halomonas kenyensis]MCG6660731.1 M81 family metallopeptidase [Halomonas kenyensis]
MARNILLAQFMHETNTFCARKTGVEAFRGFYCHEGEEVVSSLGNTQNEIGGIIEVAREHDWSLITPVATFATPGGPVTREAWEAFGQRILTAASTAGRIDGVLLCLHGAMVLEDGEDGDYRLVREIRQCLQPDVPIVVTLDLHANLDPAMVDHAEAILSYKSFPHVDMRETGRKAARLLAELLDTPHQPLATILNKLPMITLPEGGRTDRAPMTELLEMAQREEAAYPQIVDISINAGFSFSDVAEIGPSVTVVHRSAPELAQRIADELSLAMWQARDAEQEAVLAPDTAASKAVAYEPHRRGPLVLADLSDNPGDGAYADSTALLAALYHAYTRTTRPPDTLFGALHDPDTVEAAWQVGEGVMLDVSIGGKADPRFGGGPFRAQARVNRLGNGKYRVESPMWEGVEQSCGRCALLQIGAIEILVTRLATQALDLGIFRSLGVDPAEKRVVALKSTQHFRAAYGPIAGAIHLVDSGGLTSPDISRLRYRRIPRPIHPLDPEVQWQPPRPAGQNEGEQSG